jgi:hypothetical protein
VKLSPVFSGAAACEENPAAWRDRRPPRLITHEHGRGSASEDQQHRPASTRLASGKEKRKLSLGWGNVGVPEMCDYSLHHVKLRAAKVGDKLTTRDFGTGTRGFAASEDASVAVCVLPGTELSFADEVRCETLWPWSQKEIGGHKTAIFRQVNRDKPMAHHDALEFPDGQIVFLTFLAEGQQATVLQLPAAAVGTKAPQRVAYV